MRLYEDDIPLSEAANYLRSSKKGVYERQHIPATALALIIAFTFPFSAG